MTSIKSLSVPQFGFEVDCFEVGKEQLKDLFGYWADIDVANESFSKLFTDKKIIGLVVETRSHLSGGYDEPRLGSWISSLDSAREVITNEYGYEYSFGYKPIFEVWIVRDDAELWQDWEYGVVQSHVAQGWDTDFHLLQNCRCVLDCVGKLPKVVYCIYATLADGETVYSVDYYDDAVKFGVALHTVLNGWALDCVDTFFASELGITVVNDDDLDEGRADSLPVSVFYVSLPDDDVTASITK